ncbi:hypothetical protein OSTOST_01736 [Ostertagia ostertagi]
MAQGRFGQTRYTTQGSGLQSENDSAVSLRVCSQYMTCGRSLIAIVQQYVTDDQPPPPVTKETVVTLEPIYDKENSYSQEELLKLCVETRRIGEKFGIRDVSSFAGSNCALIRLYYPDVTCEQINVFLQYCQTTGSIL